MYCVHACGWVGSGLGWAWQGARTRARAPATARGVDRRAAGAWGQGAARAVQPAALHGMEGYGNTGSGWHDPHGSALHVPSQLHRNELDRRRFRESGHVSCPTVTSPGGCKWQLIATIVRLFS
eukprot:gene24782-biopygen23922